MKESFEFSPVIFGETNEEKNFGNLGYEMKEGFYEKKERNKRYPL